MAQNSIPVAYDALVPLAKDAANGAEEIGVSVGLSQNPSAKIQADLVDLIGDSVTGAVGKQVKWNAAKAAKVAGTGLLRSTESNARSFCASAMDVLKNYLGRQWSSQWEAAGFTHGSLAMPDDPLPLLNELRGYFQDHAAHENAPLGITATNCVTRADQLASARTASNLSNVNAGQAKRARDLAQTALYKRLSGLLGELKQLLEDEDPRWYAFGFDRPADGEQPGEAANLVLTPGGPGVVIADWDDARRAERYRVFSQIVGVEAEPVLVTTTEVSDYTFQGLPSGTTVKVIVVPVNDAGEGPETSEQIVVP